MNVKFSIKVVNHQGSAMLNICDADLLGCNVSDKEHVINISKNYYGEKIINKSEAENLLRESTIINMVGKETISTAVKIGIGVEQGIKTINGVPFLIVFK
ncbi:MAG: hypothetical protein K8823_282 [Cenarchaeum symbiont of Oopsacas minuta]|nr:hypothetical protein [Cenarchaeum symbiont of Oopsacas minuta]